MDTIKDLECVLEMQLYIQTDDVTDAEQLCDFAWKARAMGETTVADKMLSRAKVRMSNFDECDRMIKETMERIRTAAPDSPESAQEVIWRTLCRHRKDWADKVKSKIDTM